MSGKSGGSSKRSRQDTNTDVDSLLKDIEKYRNTSLKQKKTIDLFIYLFLITRLESFDYDEAKLNT